MGKYFVGKVFMLEKPPPDEEVVIEYQVGGQTENTPLSLLLQLDEEALSELSRLRVDEAIEGSFLSADTLRMNASVPPDTQNRIALDIQEQIASKDTLLLWTGFPKHPELIAVCDIIVQKLSGPRLNDLGIHSGKQLAWHLSTLSQSGGLTGYLRAVADGVLSGQSVSDKIDEALKIVRNIITFQFPRDLMILNRIISEVAGRLEVTGPDYGVYAEATENLFLPATIAALEEYGIPIQVARKLSPHLDQYDLDRAIQDLRAIDIGNLDGFSEFEQALIASVQTTI